MSEKLTLAIGCDHGGLELKDRLTLFLAEVFPEITVQDLGTHTAESVNYPDFANSVCKAILGGKAQLGILICGTGIGISIAANRHKGIRAALVHSTFTAEMCKAHNNANILCLGGRTTTLAEAKNYVKAWLATPFEGGRHQARLDLLDS